MTIAYAALVSLLALPPTPAAQAGPPAEPEADTVGFVVLRENGTGSAAAAKPFVADVLAALYALAGWGEVEFDYFTSRAKAKTWIDAHEPDFGILTYGAFLGLHAKYKLQAVGTGDAAGSGGGHYYLISRTASDLAGCKGQSLASNHLSDKKFIDRVVSGGAFALADFEVVETKRPVQTLKKITRDEATCALIDHAQFEALQKLDGSEGVHTVWFSKSFPANVIVAFPSASKKNVETLRDKIDEVCTGTGKKACARAGVTEMGVVEKDAYDADIAAYEG